MQDLRVECLETRRWCTCERPQDVWEQAPQYCMPMTRAHREIPMTVAALCLLEAINSLEWDSECLFCDAEHDDEDVDNTQHGEECPLFRFDQTVDIEYLKAWAKAQVTP